MRGELAGDYVIVRDQTEGNQLYGKGNYGYPRSGGGVDLDMLEACLLVELGKLDVFDGKKRLTFEDIFRLSSGLIEDFDILYIVYRDIRLGRGLVVKQESGNYDLSVFGAGKRQSNSRPAYMLRAVSERSVLDISDSLEGAKETVERRKNLLYGVVDEEGDVTYYKMHVRDPAGKVFPTDIKGRADGVLVSDRVFIFDQAQCGFLHDYGFFGKLINGIYQLSLVEACYLLGKDRLIVKDMDGNALDYDDLFEYGYNEQEGFEDRLKVYTDLRERGLVVKAGFKFGTHFRVYQEDPDDCHARFLVHAVPFDITKMWPDISRTVRLSGGVKKEILFAMVKGNSIQYLEFEWYKPGLIPGK
ncbi:tRNA-intron endonuclease EndA [methanogenic archaeon mixed culture ISO4-G1]|nr:tRNA-intron endonuclease EndA [methanogenic archaeon mixed culture ISO4-G1]